MKYLITLIILCICISCNTDSYPKRAYTKVRVKRNDVTVVDTQTQILKNKKLNLKDGGKLMPKSNKSYFIIVSSTTDLNIAKRVVQKYSNQGFRPRIIEVNDRIRVAIASYQDKKSAQIARDSISEAINKSDLWILSVEN